MNVEEINGIACSGYGVLFVTTAGLFLSCDENGSFYSLADKDKSLKSMKEEIVFELKEEVFGLRKFLDEIHPIVIHLPQSEEYIRANWMHPLIENQVIALRNSAGIYLGVPVQKGVEAFKAFDLHDDIIAQLGLEKQQQTEDIQGMGIVPANETY